MSVDVDTRVDEVVDQGTGKVRHYLQPPKGWPEGQGAEWAAYAIANRLEVEAVCGLRYVPQSEAKDLPICEPCVEAATQIVLKGGRP